MQPRATRSWSLGLNTSFCRRTESLSAECQSRHARGTYEYDTSIVRFGHAYCPLDEALSRCVIDLSGRPFLVFDVTFKAQKVGDLATELFEDFFWALADHGRLNIHLDALRGRNAHHIAETLFKSSSRALSMAVARDPRVKGVPSTKGSL